MAAPKRAIEGMKNGINIKIQTDFHAVTDVTVANHYVKKNKLALDLLPFMAGLERTVFAYSCWFQ